jgi:hypothetical protein
MSYGSTDEHLFRDLVVCSVWGFLSSVVLFNLFPPPVTGSLLLGLAGLTIAGTYVATLHIRDVLREPKRFSLGVFLVSLYVGGAWSVFLGSIIQILFLWGGVHRIFGLSIDRWYWHFPAPNWPG